MFSVALLSAATAALVGAQAVQPQPPQEQRPVIRTEANYVRVDVYPTLGGTPVMDLHAADFEVFEDGKPQKVQAFEHIVVRPAGPQAERIEPNTIEASQQLVANPRNRVFVLFLDVGHTTIAGTWTSREPLVRLVDRVLGPDDLVGIMTPEMAPSDIVFARKTQVLSGGLRDIWPWGERHTLARDEREKLYASCYPPLSQDLQAGLLEHPVVTEMRLRRRERLTLDAFRDLVDFLRGAREERTAILTITEGWLLYRRNEALTTLRTDETSGLRERAPAGKPVGVGPDGRLRAGSDAYPPGSEGAEECDRDRITLAHLDNERYFRDLLGDANRANASFYTIDPRGLAVWDAPIGPAPPPPPHVDQRNLRTRHDSMHVLANNTDGMAVIGSNDLDKGLKRIADDLTSYYLLGYYSTNGKLDGRYRQIEVRVTRPGVDVRARRGYRAATAEEVAKARAAAPAAVPEPVKAVTSAMTDLARLRAETPFQIHVAPRPGEGGVSLVWVAGQINPARPGEAARQGAGVVEITVSGGASGKAQVTLAAGQRAFLAAVPLDKPAVSGTLDVRGRLTGMTVVPFTDAVSVAVDGPPRPLVHRRGPATGNRYEPAGVLQFSRTERVRLEFPVAKDTTPGAGRVLDRNAQPLAVPVTVTTRTDAETGQHWLVADVTLAPLTLGDYAIEVAGSTGGREQRVVTGIRVGR